jgi:uncharacterized protein (TIGR03083 family)
MTTARDLSIIESEGSRIIELGRVAPHAIVPQYPRWTLRDLVVHVATVHGRTAAICETLPVERIAGPSPPSGVDPFEWAAAQLGRMLEGFATADLDAHVWTFIPDPTLRAWVRRMVIETGVHRWDAESASGQPAALLDVVAAHGLDEFDQMYLDRLGHVRTIELRATDLGRTWRFGEGEPDTTIEGSASNIFLRLMSRPGIELPADWAGAVDSLGSPADG